jgi:hypothetical protein
MELDGEIAQRLDARALEDAREAGSRLTRADAIALIRDGVADRKMTTEQADYRNSAL